MNDRNATAAQAVARWLVQNTGLTGRMELVQHIADSLGVGTVQARKYLSGAQTMTEARLVSACDRFGLRVNYDSATGWTVEEVSDADRS